MECTDMSTAGFDPLAYWERRLREHTDIVGVGFIGRTPEFVTLQYRQRAHQTEVALRRVGLATLSDRSVLDVGAGIGLWLAFWHRHHVQRVVGLDFTRASVERLRRDFSQDHVVQADVSAQPFSLASGERFDERFNIISVFDVLLHIVDDARFRAAIANLADLCQPGGWLITIDPLIAGYGYVPVRQEAIHVMVRSLDEYRKVLDENGFDVAAVVPATVLLNDPLEARNRLVYRALLAWWRASHTWEHLGPLARVVGALALGLDRVACRFANGERSPAEKLVVARKRA
jgi:SAM-dependent methyltransferase